MGWIEEDIEWFYQRFFSDDFHVSRQWYSFPIYQASAEDFAKMPTDKSPKAKRFRRVFAPLLKRGIGTDDEESKEVAKSLEEDQLEDEKNGTKKSKGSGILGDDVDDEYRPILIMKEMIGALSDYVPEATKYLEFRMHTIMMESIGE